MIVSFTKCEIQMLYIDRAEIGRYRE